MTSPLLGVLGLKRAGKDTFAARLVTQHGYTRFAFADALKQHLYHVDPWVSLEADEQYLAAGPSLGGWTHERLRGLIDRLGWETAKSLREVRRLAQEDGLGARLHIADDVWVAPMMERVQQRRRHAPVVVTDVRFPNEVAAIREAGGWTVRILNPRVTNDSDHPSENSVNDVETDFEVDNDADLAPLYEAADTLAHFLTGQAAATA